MDELHIAPEPPRLDEVDLQILRLLRLDARRSARALAREIGMSAGAVTERISRLEAAGVIRGYHADVDPVPLGYRMRVIMSIRLRGDADRQAVREYVLQLKEVIAAYFTAGRWDLVLLVRVRSQDHLRTGVLDHVRLCPGFERSETMLVLERHAPSEQSAMAHDLEQSE